MSPLLLRSHEIELVASAINACASLLSTDKFRHEFIRQVTGNNLSGDLNHSSLVDDTLNELADQLEYSLDTNALFKFAK